MPWQSSTVPVSLLFLILASAPLLAQPITPANDGTGTQVVREGSLLPEGGAERYLITGGSRARENLFHSFERLGLDANQMATFLAQPDIENILGRVIGGEPSLINGLLQVQGGNANLYLMNPAGIVFGPNARLDLSGSFLATTATGIGFGRNWFNAMGDNTYSALVGNPDSFAFSLANGGAIANFADLTVSPGQSLSLLGGTVTNTGTLTAPGGTITLAAVPAGNRVRLSQTGSLLSLELDVPDGSWDTGLNPVSLTPLSLPELLTGGNLGNASQLTVNLDGTVQLSGSNLPVVDGTTLVAGRLDAAGTAAAEINVVGDRIALLNANLDASGTNGGGTIRIGGDYQGRGSLFNASQTYVSQGSAMAADALGQGDGGRAVLWADGTTYFGGTISARGGALGGNGGFVEVSGAQDLVFRGTTDLNAPQGSLGTLLLDPTNLVIANGAGSAEDAQLGAGVPVGDLPGQILAGQDAGVDYTISEAALEGLAGNANVTLQATDSIILNDLADNALTFAGGTGAISFLADADGNGIGNFVMTDVGDALISNGRSIEISGANLTLGSINTAIRAGNFENAGNVSLTATRGNLTTAQIDAQAFSFFGSIGNGGNVTLAAPNGDITITDFITANTTAVGAGDTAGSAGSITLTAPQGTVSVGTALNAEAIASGGFTSVGNGGAVTVTASVIDVATIRTGSTALNAGSTAEQGGNITLTGNEINWTELLSNASTLRVEPLSATQSITLGAATDTNGTASLDLVSNELTTLQGGSFTSIILGRSDGTSTLAFAAPVTLNSTVTVNGIRGLVGSDTDTTWVVTNPNTVSVYGRDFANIQTLQGGRANDTVILGEGGRISGGIQGGGGTDRLVSGGDSSRTANTWRITGQNAGTVNGNRFVEFESLAGATGSDRFQFTTDTAFGGNIEGLAGPLQLTGRTVNVAGTITAQGDVFVGAEQSIQVGAINTSNPLGNGGNVTLDPTGDIQVRLINADGGNNGIGGTVTITTDRFFRATDTFPNRNGVLSSISTAGGLGGGAITIRHGGGGDTPFTIGENFGENGTRSAITNGTDTFTTGESFSGPVTRGTVQVLTTDSESVPVPCQGTCDDQEETLSSEEPSPETAKPTLEIPTVVEARTLLLELAEQTGIPPALIYISFVSPEIHLPNDFTEREAIASHQFTDYLERATPNDAPLLTVQPGDSDVLELMLVLPDGDIVRRRVDGVTRAMVVQTRRQLVNEITAPNRLRSKRYLVPSQQLYQWLIAPLEDELASQNIGNLAFVLDSGLRSIPLSVLYDGNQFLVERYSIGLMPSLSLTDTRYRDLRNVPILAMGASEFDTLLPLPAVPMELSAVTSAVPNSISYLNQDFTESNLLATRYERPYGIVHLATHADFEPGGVQNSYIQFGDRRLFLDALRQLRLNDPPVELLVLSACKTALGDDQAELGFGGLAVQAGVRSVLASLWYVSDTGTLSFMSEFYPQLQEAPTRSEALRQTQLSMLRGETYIDGGQLITPQGATPLPPNLVGATDIDLSHPYFWAAFTMIGSPW